MILKEEVEHFLKKLTEEIPTYVIAIFLCYTFTLIVSVSVVIVKVTSLYASSDKSGNLGGNLGVKVSSGAAKDLSSSWVWRISDSQFEDHVKITEPVTRHINSTEKHIADHPSFCGNFLRARAELIVLKLLGMDNPFIII
ncbi:unnamed protein product [Amaranthus hypochondriacus]